MYQRKTCVSRRSLIAPRTTQDLLRQWRVKVVRNREGSGAETERSHAKLGGGDGYQLGDRAAATDHNEVFSRLNPVQQCVRVPLEFLKADGNHADIVSNRLPSTVLGLLVHAAEHTQRHVGQIITTARILRALGEQS
jgi:hypothetical protein